MIYFFAFGRSYLHKNGNDPVFGSFLPRYAKDSK